MSDEAFKILSRAKWDPRALSSAAQRELRRGNRVGAFLKAHEAERQDPMTTDLAGWDENLARNSPWPWCFRCKSIVRAYGVENRDSMIVTVWARCHGTLADLRIEKPFRDIDKANPRWLADRIKHLVFFAT